MRLKTDKMGFYGAGGIFLSMNHLKVEHSPLGSTRSIRELESLRAVAGQRERIGVPHSSPYGSLNSR